MVHNNGKSGISKEEKRKKKDIDSCKLIARSFRGVCISKNSWTKGRGFNEIKKDENETKLNIRNSKWHRQSKQTTPGGQQYKFTPLAAYQQWQANTARARLLSAIIYLVLPLTFGHNTIILHAVVQP